MKNINPKKELYRIDNQIKRLFKNQPCRAFLLMNDCLFNMARVQTLIIASQFFMNSKMTKEEVKAQKALAIADVWINYANGLCKLYGSKEKFYNIKEIYIQNIISILNKIKDKKNENIF